MRRLVRSAAFRRLITEYYRAQPSQFAVSPATLLARIPYHTVSSSAPQAQIALQGLLSDWPFETGLHLMLKFNWFKGKSPVRASFHTGAPWSATAESNWFIRQSKVGSLPQQFIGHWLRCPIPASQPGRCLRQTDLPGKLGGWNATLGRLEQNETVNDSILLVHKLVTNKNNEIVWRAAR